MELKESNKLLYVMSMFNRMRIRIHNERGFSCNATTESHCYIVHDKYTIQDRMLFPIHHWNKQFSAPSSALWSAFLPFFYASIFNQSLQTCMFLWEHRKKSKHVESERFSPSYLHTLAYIECDARLRITYKINMEIEWEHKMENPPLNSRWNIEIERTLNWTGTP